MNRKQEIKLYKTFNGFSHKLLETNFRIKYLENNKFSHRKGDFNRIKKSEKRVLAITLK